MLMKKAIKTIVSLTLLTSMAFSIAGCAKKIEPVKKNDFKDALEEVFDIDDDDYSDYDFDDCTNIYYVDHDYYIEMYQFDDEDDALEMFEDLYDDFEDMVEDKEFKGKKKGVFNEKQGYGYILVNGESESDDFFDDDIYGGFYWSGDTLIIVVVFSDKDKYTENIDAMIRALGYPKP